LTVRATDLSPASTRLEEASLPRPARRVLFITFHFPPSVEVGAYSCAQIARYLPLHGWEPIVLTSTGRQYQFVDRRVEPTAHVIRTPAFPHPLGVYRSVKSWVGRRPDGPAAGNESSGLGRPRSGLARYVLDLASIPDMYVGWLAPAIVSGLRASRRFEVRHLLSSGPCWTNHLVGLALARLTRLPWSAHFRDPWVRAMDDERSRSISHRIQGALERAVVTRADSVVCVTEQHTELLRHRYPQLPSAKFATIPNGYDEAEWEGVVDGRGYQAARFVITYAGWLYEQRTPEPVFRALRSLIDRGDVDIRRLRIDLVGWCETARGQSVKAMAARWGLEGCLRIDGPLTKSETFRRLIGSSLLLLLAEGWALQVPAKAYEYLRAGRPILALTPTEGAIADLFRRTGGAWVIDNTDDERITAAVREAYMGWSAGRPSRTPDPGVVAEFDRARLARRFAAILDSKEPAMEHRA